MNENYKILAVNDDHEQLELLETVLRRAGYAVLTALNGNEAAEVARAEMPDLIISDVAMPEADGIDLCQQVRADQKLRMIPVMLVSGVQKDTASIVKAMQAGADDYMQIPYDTVHLVARATRLIERRRQEKNALLESENRFRNLIENSTDIISVLAPDGTVIYESPSLENVLGYPPEELIGKNAFSFIHPEDSDRVKNYFESALQKPGPSRSVQYRFRHHDGTWRIMESVGKHFDDPFDGRVAIINSRDITAQQETLEALRRSEERFKNQYKSIPIPTYTWKKSEDDFVLVDYNDAAEQITRGLIGDFLGATSTKMYDDMPEIREDLNRCFKEQTIVRRETEYRFRTTGEIKHLDISYVFIPPDLVLVHSRDATEQIEAEKSLRMSEERFRLASLATEDALWDWDLVTDSLWLSNAFYDLLGYKPGEVVPHIDLWIAALHPDDKERTVKHLREVIDSGEHFWADEYRMRTAAGSYAHIFDRGYIVHDEQGKPVRMIGAAINFTERKESEKAIRFQAHLLDTVEQAVVATDLRGTVTYWNKFAQKLYGWTSAEAVGRSIMELTTPEISQEQAVEIMARLGQGKSWSGEFTVRNRENKMFPAYVCDSPVTSADGELIGIVGISIDITERKKAEKALAAANQRAIREYDRLLRRLTKLAQIAGSARDLNTIFRAILEFARATVDCSGFFISLYKPEKRLRIPAYAWDAAGQEFDVSGLPPMEMSDSPHSRAVTTGKVIIENDFQTAMVGQPIFHIGMDKDPSLPQSCLVAPMAFMGRIVGAIEVQSTSSDAYTPEHATAMQMAANLAANAIENVRLLEQERDREEQLRQSQKLESVGRLAGGIAHDFNNMLTAINGYSDLTLRRLKADDPLRRNIEEIKKAGERSAALTHQLLAFSRKQVLKPKLLNINEVIIDTSKLLQRLIGEDVQLSIVTNPKVGRVEVDPGQLTQVIMNLAVNARDAMPHGGSLIIETANVYLDDEYAALHYPTKSGSYVMLAVSDNGVGIEEGALPHIFEPFYTTKEVGKGTGLGLATVYGIVKQSGGYIWVYSEPGKGTSFKIYFPRVAEASALEEQNGKTENIPGGNEVVLLVEDEDAVRNLARQILASCGYRIIEARNGIEAIELCQKSDCRIDLLLTDVVMPGMGGRELGEKVTAINPQIRQLFMSGYTDDAIIRQGMITEGMNFIQKPFTFEALAQKVRRVLDTE